MRQVVVLQWGYFSWRALAGWDANGKCECECEYKYEDEDEDEYEYELFTADEIWVWAPRAVDANNGEDVLESYQSDKA